MSIVLDQGISITYMSQGYEDTEADLERLAKLYPKSAHSKKDILYLLRKQNPDGFIVETQCTIQIHGLRFEFNNKGKLLNITVQAESKPEYDCKNT
ncbi:MAG: hypothetical protein OEZ10_02025 [Gammaproteobacteria bacterium]|nr:hypothetical protein [Gammaproteobacteria bacterium]